MRGRIQDMTQNLIFISKIQVNDILDVRSKRLMAKGRLTSLYRTVIATQESRESCFLYFQNLYKQTFDLIHELHRSGSPRVQCELLLKHIVDSKTGLSHHKETYSFDVYHVSKIEGLIEYIETESNAVKQTWDEK